MRMLLGVDIVEHSTIGKLLRYNKYLPKVFTNTELTYTTNINTVAEIRNLSGKFAVKEAVLKALGLGLFENNAKLTDIETLSDETGKPYLSLFNNTKQVADSLGVRKYTISISHSCNFSVAIVAMF
jgi:holo-[acyl-carrier protein] synthase